VNQNKFTQPHVRAKLVRSGAVETLRKAKDRTIAVEMADTGLIEELETDLAAAVSNPKDYFKNGTSGDLAYSARFLLANLPKKFPAAAKIRKLAKEINALIDRGLAEIDSIARTFAPIEGVQFKTRAKVSLILAKLPV